MAGRARPKDALFEQFARVGKALANPKRLQLIDVLAQSERTVESLAQATALKLTTASAHLQALRQSGLVRTRREGARVYYRLADDDVAGLYLMMRDVAGRYLAETERAAREFLGQDDIEAVGRDGLLDRIRSGELVMLDVRPAVEFDAGHIEGAIGIPLEGLYERLSELPADLDVVAYCRGEYCVLAYEAVRLLRSSGRHARRMQGGMLEWRLENHPVVTTSGSA
jgi:DNA-binding transcriptional ArsR family regulator